MTESTVSNLILFVKINAKVIIKLVRNLEYILYFIKCFYSFLDL